MTTTLMCECSHHWSMHAEAGQTAATMAGAHGRCLGYVGSATPGPFEPCPCTGFSPWSGPTDARTGEPVRPLTMTVDARVTPPEPVPAGPGLALVIARTRLTRAVLVTVLGTTDTTTAYGGTEQSAADYAEVTEAAKALVAAEADWQAAIERRQREKGLRP